MNVLKACAKCHEVKPFTKDYYLLNSKGKLGYICIECIEAERRATGDLHWGADEILDIDIRKVGAVKQDGIWYRTGVDLTKKPQSHPTTRELIEAVRARKQEGLSDKIMSRVINVVPLNEALEIYEYELTLAMMHRQINHRARMDKPFPSYKHELVRNVLVDAMDSREFEMEVCDGV